HVIVVTFEQDRLRPTVVPVVHTLRRQREHHVHVRKRVVLDAVVARPRVHKYAHAQTAERRIPHRHVVRPTLQHHPHPIPNRLVYATQTPPRMRRVRPTVAVRSTRTVHVIAKCSRHGCRRCGCRRSRRRRGRRCSGCSRGGRRCSGWRGRRGYGRGGRRDGGC